MTIPQPWTFVLSEYLDLAFVLRTAGELVVNARSATEALHCLNRYRPVRIVIDRSCYGSDNVLTFAQEHHPDIPIEIQEHTIERILAAV